MAELTPAERRAQRIAEAKRRAAEKRGTKYVPEKETSPAAQPAAAPQETGNSTESVARPAAAQAEETDRVSVTQAPTAAEVPGTEPAARGPERAVAPPSPSRTASAPPEADASGTESTVLRTDIRTLNRREFLTYSWGAAVGVVSAQSLVATGLLMYPRFRAGEFGGDFLLGSTTSLPSTDAAPQGDPIGKFWLVNTAEGPRALYMVCTHLGCLYKWVEANRRFECPCHGSKFTREGEYIEGPAPRGLDQFVVELQDNGVAVGATEDKDGQVQPPALTAGELEIVIKTGQRIQGKSHS